MKKMVALKRVYYPLGGNNSKEYKAGESFEAQDKDAERLALIRVARLAGGEAPKPVPEPQPILRSASVEVRPLDEPASEPAVENKSLTAMSTDTAPELSTGMRRRYRRSDMQSDS